MEQLTGREAEHHDSGDIDSPDQIRRWLDEGRPICMNTRGDEKKAEEGGYVANHAYYVIGVDKDGNVQLGNPWGSHLPVKSMSMEDFEKYADSVDVGSKP